MRIPRSLQRLLAMALIASTAAPGWAATSYTYRIPFRAVDAQVGPPVVEVPGLTITPNSVSVLATAGQVSSQAISLLSSGSGPLTITSAVLTSSGNGLSLVDGCSGKTLASGTSCELQLQFAPTLAGTTASSVALMTSMGASTVPVSATAQADESSARLSELISDAGTATANGGSGITLSAKVVDQFGNLLGAGQPVAWSTTRGVLSKSSTTTDAQGIATVTLTSTSAGAATVTARGATGAGLTAAVTFLPDLETAKVSAISAAQSTMRSDTTPVTVTATLVDGNNNLMPAGTAVKWSTSLGTLSASSTQTNASGQATVQISSTDAGTATVVAKIGNGDAGKAVSVYFTAPSISYMTATPSSVPGNGSTYSFVYAVATYPDGGAYVGPITFTSLNCGVFENSSGTIAKTTSNTGSASAYLVSLGSCVTSVKATVRGLYSSSVTVTFTTP